MLVNYYFFQFTHTSFDIQFRRAIRKIASSMLSAALQLIFAHYLALRSYFHAGRLPCKPGSGLHENMAELFQKNNPGKLNFLPGIGHHHLII